MAIQTIVYEQLRIRPEKWDFEIKKEKGFPNLAKTTKPSESQQKEITCRIVDFAVPTDNRIRLKGSEKRDKYADLARKLKKAMGMKVTVIPIVIDALGTVTKIICKGTGGFGNQRSRDHPNYSALLRSARILRRVLENSGDLLSLRLQGKPSANAGWKNSQKRKIMISQEKINY